MALRDDHRLYFQLVANETLTKFILAVREVDRAQRGTMDGVWELVRVTRASPVPPPFAASGESFGAGAAEQVALSVLAWEESAPSPLLRVLTQLRDGAGPQMFLSPRAFHLLETGADRISSSSGVGAGGGVHAGWLRAALPWASACAARGLSRDRRHPSPGACMWDTLVQVVPTCPWLPLPLRSVRVFTVGPGLTSITHLLVNTVRSQFCPRLTSPRRRTIKPSPVNTKTFKRLSLGTHNPSRAWPPRNHAAADARRADAHSAVQPPRSPTRAIALSATGLNPRRIAEWRVHPERSMLLACRPTLAEVVRTFSGPGEKDRQLLVEYAVAIDELLRLPAAYRATVNTAAPELETVADDDLYCHCAAELVAHRRLRQRIPCPALTTQLELSNSTELLLQMTNITRDFREDVEECRYFWLREIWAGSAMEGGLGGGGNNAGYVNSQQPAGTRAAHVLSVILLDALRHALGTLDYLRTLKNQRMVTRRDPCLAVLVLTWATHHVPDVSAPMQRGLVRDVRLVTGGYTGGTTGWEEWAKAAVRVGGAVPATRYWIDDVNA
ncbi:hypothetical protein DFH09DRAFT_1306070 [Mycena vulgaris]|nr:hypothetical protein DFH09DRAFT_1306070 [Mycena vulgaris]